MKLSALGLLVVFLLLAGSCGAASSALPFVTLYSASLSGAKEVPPTASAATGSAQMLHALATRTFDLEVTVNGIAPANITGFHIHVGAAGVNGPIIVDLGGAGVTFVDIGGGVARAQASGVAFPQVNEGDLLAGNCYLNLHTGAFPGGEIRSQLTLGL